jgi:cytochrome P450
VADPGKAPARRWPLGWLPDFHRRPLQTLAQLRRRYGSPVRFFIGPWPLWLVSEPEQVGTVLTASPAAVHKGPGMDAANPLLGAGLFLAEGDAWIGERRRLAPCLAWDRLASGVPAMLAFTASTVAAWPAGIPWEATAAMADISLGWALGLLLGVDPDAVADERPAVRAAVRDLLEFFYRRSRSWYRPPYHWRGFNRAYWRAGRQLTERLGQWRQRAGHGLAPGIWACLDGQPADQAEALTLLLAGQETTGLALAWALALMADHPAVAARVREEALTAWDGSAQGFHPDRLPWARAVFLEAIRLYPPVWLISRTLRRPQALGGLTLPAESHLLISPWVVQRDGAHFADPDRFAPQRWLTRDPWREQPFAYLPFGAGVRRCPGQVLAVWEGTAVLAHLMRRWRVAWAGPARPRPAARLNLVPAGGVWLRLEPVAT